ncbi:MAG: glycine cleavage system protein H [Proteobacteria bacterium]|nr:glycine cleavage system protein H [Desulfobacula sp.]MBU3953338.1 glycine cleavage system protein H [Pseudomonadota bacterium]MBU4130770.1 glycine cleavage system protein H [Pseudomonadota bacterium]
MKSHGKTDSPACLWMQAGVVKKKMCFKKFACADCRFERALARVCSANQALTDQGTPLKGRSAALVFWKEKLKKAPLAKRPCIHHMKGVIGFKTCPRNYRCVDCEFDQYFNDQFTVYTLLKPVQFEEISGIFLPMGYYFSQGHTWVKIEDNGMVRMGIDDFACKLLGKFDTLSCPLMGKRLTRGETALTLTRGGNRVSFLAPVNGVVTEVNAQVRNAPELIPKAPYTQGWILTLYCPDLKQDLKHLFFMDTSEKFMTAAVSRLYEFLEEHTQLAAADGGTLMSDIYGNLPGIAWEDLVKIFISQGP